MSFQRFYKRRQSDLFEAHRFVFLSSNSIFARVCIICSIITNAILTHREVSTKTERDSHWNEWDRNIGVLGSHTPAPERCIGRLRPESLIILCYSRLFTHRKRISHANKCRKYQIKQQTIVSVCLLSRKIVINAFFDVADTINDIEITYWVKIRIVSHFTAGLYIYWAFVCFSCCLLVRRAS